MNLTTTQNSAVDVTARRIARNRAIFFQRSRAAVDKQLPDIRTESAIDQVIRRVYHSDNGR